MKLKTLILILVSFTSIILPQNKIKELAEGTNFKFDLKEFENRYMLMPIVRKGKSEDVMRSEMLYSFIAEKLWASEAEKEGFDTTAITKYTFGAMEKFIVRDALFNIEVTQKAKISERNYKTAAERGRIILDINYIYSTDKNEIEDLFSKIMRGASFDSLLAQRKEFEEQKNKLEVGFGDLEENIEDAVFNIAPGELTGPVKSSIGWFIVRLNGKSEKQFNGDREIKAEKQNEKKIVEDRAVDKAYQEYYAKALSNKTVNTNGILFWSMADNISKVLQNKWTQKDSSVQSVNLDENDFNIIEQNMGADSLDMNFIEFDSRPVTAREFLHQFIFEGFYTNNVNSDIISSKLQSRTRRFIELELLAREGFKRGLNELPEVKNQIEIWKDYYLAEQLKNNFNQNIVVTDEDFNKYINELDSAASTEYVSVFEILVSDLQTVEKIFMALDQGGDFRKLAREYTIREEAKTQGGELGWISTNDFGEIGRVAAGMEIGEVYGPIKVPEGYSIIKLSDKKDNLETVEKIKEMEPGKIRAGLKARKLLNAMIDETVKLANEQKLKVNQELLIGSKAINQNMLVYRYFGFGGRALAYPLTPIFTEWVEPWKESIKALP